MIRIGNSLRARMALAFLGLTVVLSTSFAVITFVAFEWVRPLSVEERLGGMVDEVAEQTRNRTVPSTVITEHYSAWAVDLLHLDGLPDHLANVGVGRHAIERANGVSEVVVIDRGPRRLVLELEDAQISHLEAVIGRRLAALLGAAVILLGFVSLMLGATWSGRVIAPVTRLAQKVQDLNDAAELDFDEDWGEDEVGELARSFATTWSRQSKLLEREKAFTADASHELRTSVAVIQNTVELLQAHGADSDERLARLHRAATHMGRVVEAMLYLGREETAETREHTLQVCDVAALVKDLSDSRPAADIRIEVVAELHLQAQPEALEMVISNLVDNAIAHAGAGPVEITVNERGVRVGDSGPGIPEDELPKVFERGFRGRRRTGSGAGLGLAIVKRICERNSWAVELSNRSGGGIEVRLGLKR